MAVATKDTPVGFELDGVKKQIPIQMMGSRAWGRFNPIHFDPVVAAEHGLSAPIAVGMMSSAYISETSVNFFGTAFFQNATMEGKYVRPIYPNEIITTRGIVRAKTPEGNGFRFAVELWCENEEHEKKTVAMVTALVE